MKIFKNLQDKLSKEVIEFISNMGWSVFGNIVPFVLTFLLNLYVIKHLINTEYGKYSLVISYSAFFIILFLQGLGVSSVKMIAHIKNECEKAMIVQYVLYRYIKFITFFIILFGLIGAIVLLFNVNGNPDLLFLGTVLVFTVFQGFKQIFDSYLRGKKEFKTQAILNIVTSIILFLTAISLVYKIPTYVAYLSAIILSYIIFILYMYIVEIRPKINSCVSMPLIKNDIKIELIRYGRFLSIGAIGGFIFVGVDKILLNSYLNVNLLGIYSAYFSLIVIPLSQIRMVFINVFFPTFVNVKDKVKYINKINMIFLLLFIPSVAVITLVGYIILNIINYKYGVDVKLLTLLSIYSILYFIVSIKQWMLASFNSKSVLYSSTVALLSGIIYFIFVLISLQIYHNVYIMVISMVISMIIFVIINEIAIRRYTKLINSTNA